MNAFRITFEDGNTIETNMNATLEEAKAYYIGQAFNFGDTDEHPKDRMVKAVKVQMLLWRNEIERAVEEGKAVYWRDPQCRVVKEPNGAWSVVSGGGHISLTSACHLGIDDFVIVEPHGKEALMPAAVVPDEPT